MLPKLEASNATFFSFMQNGEQGKDVGNKKKKRRASDALWLQGSLGSDGERWAAMLQGLLMGVPEAVSVRLRNRLLAAFTHGT